MRVNFEKSKTILDHFLASTFAKFVGSHDIEKQLLWWMFYQIFTKNRRVGWGARTVWPILRRLKFNKQSSKNLRRIFRTLTNLCWHWKMAWLVQYIMYINLRLYLVNSKRINLRTHIFTHHPHGAGSMDIKKLKSFLWSEDL